jgi:feruloyl esterase
MTGVRIGAILLLLSLSGATTMVAGEIDRSPRIDANSPPLSCTSLRGLEVPSSAIGLPTTGAYVKSAKLMHDRRGEYCKVLGGVRPIDRSAQEIRFEVNLPRKWNRKAVQFGGGTFDGWMGGPTSGLRRGPIGVKGMPVPLARGFATFGGDSGHHKRYFLLPDALNTMNASFAKNPEERRNYAHDAIKKTHDAATFILEQGYGVRPSRMFFLGGSTGGREAFVAMQRWPEDYDGVLGAYAAWDQIELDLQFIRVSQAMYSKGGFLPKSKTRLLARSVLEACDTDDGVRDAIIANPDACRFDPATLLCSAPGRHRRCLTPQELRTVQTFATEQRTTQALWNGVQSIPGFNVLAGTDLTGTMGLLHHAERHPKFFLNSFFYIIGNQVVRYFLAPNDKFDPLALDTATGGPYASDLLPNSKIYDAGDANLTRFARHGGKFLMLHGTADATIPTNSSVMYYKMVENKMGEEETDRFLRFYLVPGFGHERGAFKAGFDALGALDRWIDTGEAPNHLVAVDNNRRSGGRTRPLCEYPAWPRYKGGDVNAASSFVCATE